MVHLKRTLSLLAFEIIGLMLSAYGASTDLVSEMTALTPPTTPATPS